MSKATKYRPPRGENAATLIADQLAKTWPKIMFGGDTYKSHDMKMGIDVDGLVKFSATIADLLKLDNAEVFWDKQTASRQS